MRLLASLSERRLDGRWSAVPTAREQGVEVLWPILRGVYASADFPAAEVAEVARQIAHPSVWPLLQTRVRERAMQPWLLTGAALEEEVQAQLQRYRLQADRFGLRPR